MLCEVLSSLTIFSFWPVCKATTCGLYVHPSWLLQLDIHGQLALVKAGDGFDLLEQTLRPACQAQLLPGHPTRYDVSGNVRRREHRRVINGGGAQAAGGGQRPDGFALHIVGVKETDVPADGRIHAEEIEHAVLARGCS